MTQLFAVDTLASGFPSGALTGGTFDGYQDGVNSTVRKLSTSRGAGVVSKTSASAAATNVEIMDSGSLRLLFAIRVNAVSFSSSNSLTANAWGLESNAMANFQPAVYRVLIYTNAGAYVGQLKSYYAPASEWGTAAAARNWSAAQSAVSAADGDWLIYQPLHAESTVGAGASGYTLTWSYSGTTAAANGDSYITTVETITEYVESVERVPRFSPYPQLLGH